MKCRRTILAILAAALCLLGAANLASAEVYPALSNPLAIVNFFGSSTADNGAVTTFSRVNPNGTLSAFSIPAGKTFIITSFEGFYLNNATLPQNLVFKLGIAGDTNPGFLTSSIYFYSGYGTFGASELFPVPVNVPFIGKVYSVTGTPINSGYLRVRVKGYFYPYP
jgi:hypothetical protein